MAEKSGIRVGSRVKVVYKDSLHGKPIEKEFKGELYNIHPTGDMFHLIGYHSSEPSQLTQIKIMKQNIVSIGGTRLPKYFSELLAKYIAKLKEIEKARKQISDLERKQYKMEESIKKIADQAPEKYMENNKGKVPVSVIQNLIFKRYSETSKNMVIMKVENVFSVNCLVIERTRDSKNLYTDREYDGTVYVSDYKKEDVMAHLKYHDANFTEPIDMGALNNYFDIKQEFYPLPNNHSDCTIDIRYNALFTIKKSVVKEDIPRILNLLGKFEVILNSLKSKREMFR